MFSEDFEANGGDTLTVLRDTKRLMIKDTDIGGVWEELCYTKAETLGDAEEVAGRWWYNLS